MSALLIKEMKLSSLLLTYLFIGFAFMTLIPGYPILCGAFFVTLGIFQSFQMAREANDILYSALLPIAKRDVVKGKYIFVMTIEACSFCIMFLLTLLRMTVFTDAAVYRQNALMNANFFFLGTALIIFGMFNAVFVGGFFRTAYKLGKPFVIYIAAAFGIIGLAEAAHHVPGLEALNVFGFAHVGLQLATLCIGIAAFAALTYLSYNKACRNFEKIDL